MQIFDTAMARQHGEGRLGTHDIEPYHSHLPGDGILDHIAAADCSEKISLGCDVNCVLTHQPLLMRMRWWCVSM